MTGRTRRLVPLALATALALGCAHRPPKSATAHLILPGTPGRDSTGRDTLGHLAYRDTVVPPAFPPSVPPPMEPASVIQLKQPKAGDFITSPFVVEGDARSNWYFEGQFLVRLLSQNGVELARTAAHGQGDWTSEKFVHFTAALFFTIPPADTAGTLVFQSDNPSGIKERLREHRVPVRFPMVRR